MSEKQNLSKMATYWRKWMGILFVVSIPHMLSEMLADERIIGNRYVLNLVLQILNILTTLAYGLLLLSFGNREDNYRKAGIFRLGCMAMGMVIAFSGKLNALFSLVAVGCVSIFGILAEYYEYNGHAITVSPFHKELSQKWLVLWKWYAGMFVLIFSGPFLAPISAAIGYWFSFGGTVGLLVVRFMKVIYLENTFSTFRKYNSEK